MYQFKLSRGGDTYRTDGKTVEVINGKRWRAIGARKTKTILAFVARGFGYGTLPIRDRRSIT